MGYFFIMRHGEAESHAGSDCERELTAYGAAYSYQIAQQLAEFIEKESLPAPTLLHSPFIRARQTAKEIQRAVPEISRVIALDVATPDDNPKDCFDALELYAEHGFILVSHMPLVAALASLLENGNQYGSQGFHTSEIRAYETDVWGLGCALLRGRMY